MFYVLCNELKKKSVDTYLNIVKWISYYYFDENTKSKVNNKQ